MYGFLPQSLGLSRIQTETRIIQAMEIIRNDIIAQQKELITELRQELAEVQRILTQVNGLAINCYRMVSLHSTDNFQVDVADCVALSFLGWPTGTIQCAPFLLPDEAVVSIPTTLDLDVSSRSVPARLWREVSVRARGRCTVSSWTSRYCCRHRQVSIWSIFLHYKTKYKCVFSLSPILMESVRLFQVSLIGR